MSESGIISIKGQIVEVRDGERKISRTYTYGYRTLIIRTNQGQYSVLVNTKKINKYGFLPKVGQWIRVEGRLSASYGGLYEGSIDYLSKLEHIEPQKHKPIKKNKNLKNVFSPIITDKSILVAIYKGVCTLEALISRLNINDYMDVRYMKNKLKRLVHTKHIIVEVKNGKEYYRIRNH